MEVGKGLGYDESIGVSCLNVKIKNKGKLVAVLLYMGRLEFSATALVDQVSMKG